MNRMDLFAGMSVMSVCQVCLTCLSVMPDVRFVWYVCLFSNTTMEDGSFVHVCKCTKEMGELAGGPCNLDWDTAGDDRPTNPPPKLEVGNIFLEHSISIHLVIWSHHLPSSQCYQCDSHHENCSENQMGDAVFCGDEMNGCLISRGSSSYVSSDVHIVPLITKIMNTDDILFLLNNWCFFAKQMVFI